MKKIIAVFFAVLVISPVSAFAQQADVDPIAAPSCAAISVNLRYGARDTTDNSVSILQDFLNARGYLASQPSGFFGQMTFVAVKSFQNANGISASGYVGPITRAKIQEIDCNGATSFPVVVAPTVPVRYPPQTVTCPVGFICSAIVDPKPYNPNPSSYVWYSTDAAASDSLEGQFRAQGKTWTKTSGAIAAGSYVQDILEGRLDQPRGRGAIGRVTSVYYDSVGSQNAARVDFGRGYTVPIRFSELSLVSVNNPSTPSGYVWYSSHAAAADSLEGQLRSQGAIWNKTSGTITAGSYVQDILEGRLDQPMGRGAVGKVTSVYYDNVGSQSAAQVDFGRGYTVGIRFSELSLLSVAMPTTTQIPSPYRWYSTDAAASDSLEGQFRAQGKTWTKTSGAIAAGSYVQDILEGRLDQPRGRGAIGKVSYVTNDSSASQGAAMVDFGRGYAVSIRFAELSLLSVTSPFVQTSSGWHSTDAAASDSVEGQLRAQGKTWTKISGTIIIGSYVQDILEGRLHQPVGRGAIGKVTSVSVDSSTLQSSAQVDFGRGYIATIRFSELSFVSVN